MSTRANIVIKDGNEMLFFYRHSDGYPEGTMPTLKIFRDWMATGKIRNNISQASGWLILLGAMEYNTLPAFKVEDDCANVKTIEAPKDWKCGAYEPTTGIHGDIEYLYIIDLNKKEITCYEDWTEEGEGKGAPVNINEQLA